MYSKKMLGSRRRASSRKSETEAARIESPPRRRGFVERAPRWRKGQPEWRAKTTIPRWTGRRRALKAVPETAASGIGRNIDGDSGERPDRTTLGPDAPPRGLGR